MPLLLLEPAFWVGSLIVGGTVAAGVSSYEAGKTAGTGIGNAATIIGIGAGVALIIWAMHKK